MASPWKILRMPRSRLAGFLLALALSTTATAQDLNTVRDDQINRLKNYVVDCDSAVGLVRDSLVLNGSSFHPATPDAAGFALVALSALDHLDKLPGCRTARGEHPIGLCRPDARCRARPLRRRPFHSLHEHRHGRETGRRLGCVVQPDRHRLCSWPGPNSPATISRQCEDRVAHRSTDEQRQLQRGHSSESGWPHLSRHDQSRWRRKQRHRRHLERIHARGKPRLARGQQRAGAGRETSLARHRQPAQTKLRWHPHADRQRQLRARLLGAADAVLQRRLSRQRRVSNVLRQSAGGRSDLLPKYFSARRFATA